MLEQVLRDRLGGFLLQGQMHPLVAAVLLRMPGLDALDGDAQAQPPYRELAQAEQGLRTGERHVVIGADCVGQAELVEDALGHGGRVGSCVLASG